MNSRQKQVLQTQLTEEQKQLKMLEKIYQKASQDCADKIKELSTRTDMENLQSIIYQKQYQQALKNQIDGILNQLHSDSFSSISDFLGKSYENGYLGAMYDLNGQGIPILTPIDPKNVVKALETDSKLSKGLYNRLGEDVTYLKKSVRAELSRGVAQGSSWNEIADHIANGMNSPFIRAKNNAMRIARTEGHRVQMESHMNALKVAKNKGADIVKQWDATLDARTRESHAMCDGEIRELDEPFSNGLMFPSDPAGHPVEVINCRCALLQRAEWGLDDEELERLQEKAEYFGLDKSTNFEEYKKKYLNFSPMYDLLYTKKPNSIISDEQLQLDAETFAKAFNELPEKVKKEFSNVTIEFGHDASACDIINKTIYIGIGTTKEEIHHEYGHLIERYMLDENEVKAYKMYLTEGLSVNDIYVDMYHDNLGNPKTIFLLNGDKFESEYQSRLYVENPLDALNEDGGIKIDVLYECVSEAFRKYMNKESLLDISKKLIEGAVL